jgi:hypothetical protein
LNVKKDKRFVSQETLCPKLFPYHEGTEFNGILSGLSRECGGNVHEKGIIKSSYVSFLHLVGQSRSLPVAFALNRNVLDFLYEKRSDFALQQNMYRIAVTGEYVSFSLGAEHSASKSMNPTTALDYKGVFGAKDGRANHLVLLVAPGEQVPRGERSLDWTIGIKDQGGEEPAISEAGRIAPGLIRARSGGRIYVLKRKTEMRGEEAEKFLGKGRTDLPIGNTLGDYI